MTAFPYNKLTLKDGSQEVRLHERTENIRGNSRHIPIDILRSVGEPASTSCDTGKFSYAARVRQRTRAVLPNPGVLHCRSYGKLHLQAFSNEVLGVKR